MSLSTEINPDIRILKQHIDQAILELERNNSVPDEGLGTLIYLGSHQDAIPRNLLLDPHLESGEIHTWALLKIQLVNPALPTAIPRQDELMKVLKCSRPVLSRHLQVLRAMRWLTLCAEVRGKNGQFKGHVYTQHDKPLSLQETLFLDSGYIRFLEQPSTGPALKRLRQVKQAILMHIDYQMVDGIDLCQPPSALEQSLEQLKAALNSIKPDPTTLLSYPTSLYGYEEEEDVDKDEVPSDSSVDNSRIELFDDSKLDPNHHVKSFYMGNSRENPTNHRVKNHVKNFYMDIRSSSSSSSSYIKTTTTTHRRLNFPKAIQSERERLYAAKLLSALEDERQQQFALDYLTDRIKAGEKGTDKPVGNAIRYLDWIVKRIVEGTLPESAYGIRHHDKTAAAKVPVDDVAEKQREHAAWVRSLQEKGIKVDPHTGMPLKRDNVARR
jgi:hypothetical protein